MWGGGIQLFEVTNSNDEKIYIYNTPLPLDGRQSTTAHTTTNQKQASLMDGSMERMCAGREARGEARYHYFGGVRSGEANKNLNKSLSLIIIFFLGHTIKRC